MQTLTTRVELFVDFLEFAVFHLGVDLGRLDACMAKHFLDES